MSRKKNRIEIIIVSIALIAIYASFFWFKLKEQKLLAATEEPGEEAYHNMIHYLVSILYAAALTLPFLLAWVFIKKIRQEPVEFRRKTAKAFIIFTLLLASAVVGFQFLITSPTDNQAQLPLRVILDANGKFFHAMFNESSLAPVFPKSAAVKNVRVNGSIGMGDDFDPATWKLNVVKFNPAKTIKDSTDTLHFTIDDIKRLPKTEVICDFKCVEGWSEVTHWGGVKFSDFIRYYKLGTRSGNAFDFDHQSDLAQYVGLETPDTTYYVGNDMASMIHPQTILCYEMNGKPLPFDQGAPLRLIIPTKYGIKNIKRIGNLFFSDTRPRDYWFERGYDYYSGL